MAAGGLQIDDGLFTVASEALDDGVLASNRPITATRKGADAKRISIAAQHPGGVDDMLDRAAVHHSARLGLQCPASLARFQHYRVPTMQEHGGLEAGTSPKARVHEHHGQDLFLQPPGDLAPLDSGCQGEKVLNRGRAPVLQGEKVPFGHCSTCFSPMRRMSASLWEKESGGSNLSTAGSVEVPVRIRCPNSAVWTVAAGRSRCKPSSSPRPVTRRTPRSNATRAR